jgi:hypothetical protein
VKFKEEKFYPVPQTMDIVGMAIQVGGAREGPLFLF